MQFLVLASKDYLSDESNTFYIFSLLMQVGILRFFQLTAISVSKREIMLCSRNILFFGVTYKFYILLTTLPQEHSLHQGAVLENIVFHSTLYLYLISFAFWDNQHPGKETAVFCLSLNCRAPTAHSKVKEVWIDKFISTFVSFGTSV